MTTKTLSLQRGLCAALAVLALTACNTKPASAPVADTAPEALIGMPKAAKRIAPSTLPLMTTPGTWVSPPQGPLFETIDTLDPRHAMVYVYRPSTSWEDQELQAPSFFVNGKKVFGLKSGSYTWLELHAGTYNFYAKRPLSILFIKKIFEMELNVLGGRTYFLRYSEDAPVDYDAEGLIRDNYMQAGFLQEVPDSIALVEIASLKMDHPGLYFASDRVVQQRWVPFESFPATGVDPDAAPDATAEEPAKDGWWARTRSFFGGLF